MTPRAKDSAMPDAQPDIAETVRALLPPAVGVLFGVFARWSREAKAGRVKSLRRLVLLDLPTMGALTVVATVVAQRLDADTVTATSIGVAFGFVGLEALNTFVSLRLRPDTLPGPR
mgnify:CR=1 FL=1|jgi:Phage holin family (Lysis protein S).